MADICVKRVFKAPIDQVFEAVINADNYLRLPKLVSVDRVKESVKDKDGIGTIREVKLGLVWFREEFIYFERPTRVDYRIIKSRPHFEHQAGSFQFRIVPEGTEVIWSSSYSIPLPLISGLASAFVKPWIEATFLTALFAMEKRFKAIK